MAHLSLQSVFRAARPSTTVVRDPSVFLRRCRAPLPCHDSTWSIINVSSAAHLKAAAPQLRPHLSSQPRTSTRTRTRTRTQTQTQTRTFSSTAVRPATVVVKNPRVDEEGNDMTIEISERAAKRLRQITSAPPRRNTLAKASAAAAPASDCHLRVTVTSGGCHGFQYLMSLEGPSKIDEEEDTVFVAKDGEGEGEAGAKAGAGASKGQAMVVMDEPSLELLKGSTVDFTTELIGSQFKIVGNPRATSSCGCGTSFDIA